MTVQEKRDALIALIKILPEDKLDEAGAALGSLMKQNHWDKQKPRIDSYVYKNSTKITKSFYTNY